MRSTILLCSLLVVTMLSAQESSYKTELEAFTSLSVYNRINVKLIKGDKNQAEVRIKDITEDRVQFTNENGHLSLRVSDPLFETYQVNVVITYTSNIKNISAYSISDVMQEGIFKTDSIFLEGRSDGNISLYLDVTYANVKALEGSAVVLDGFVKTLDAEAQSNGTVEAFDLEAEEATVKANLKGRIKITVNQSIEGEATLNGYVGYKGSPKTVNVKKSLGGSVQKL